MDPNRRHVFAGPSPRAPHSPPAPTNQEAKEACRNHDAAAANAARKHAGKDRSPADAGDKLL